MGCVPERLAGRWITGALARSLLLLVMLCRSAGGAGAEEVTCWSCGKKITSGKVLVFTKGDKEYRVCEDCAGSGKRCVACGLPIKRGSKEKLCSDCRERIRPCAICGEPVLRGKVTSDGRAICEKCWTGLPRCKRCGMPYKKGDGGGGLCPDCAEKAPRCVACGEVLTREVVYFGGDKSRPFCPRCARDGPKCSLCGRPVAKGEGEKIGGELVGPCCAEDAKICDCCGRLLHGKIYSYPYGEGVFCERCHETKPHCYVCNVPIGQNPRRLAGGRVMCRTCAKTAVFDKGELSRIAASVARYFRDRREMTVVRPIKLVLTPDLSKERELVNPEKIGGNELGLFQRKGNNYTIFITDGIPRRLCFETYAHEWGHAWFEENGHQDHDLFIREGFAQWMASKFLVHMEYSKLLERLETRDDHIYGDSYRYLRDLQSRQGEEGVLRFIRDRPPPGWSPPPPSKSDEAGQ